MKVELEAVVEDIECNINATLFDFGVVIRHRAYENEDEIEVLEGPEFKDIVVTDEDGNQWQPRGNQLELVDDLLRDWWYTEVEENRL